MDKEKVMSKPMDLPLEDGTGKIVDDLAKQREEIAKATEKEFAERAKIMDEINNAEGKTFKIKNMTEKLTLDESDERQLNEDYDESYDKLVHDLFGAMHKVLSKSWLGYLSLEEVLDAIDEATMHLEDLMMEDDNGGVYVEEDLDEALPKDLAKAYKNHPFRVGSGAQNAGYGNIKRKYTNGGTSIDYSRPAEIDFQNSTYEEITPEEALKLKREGHADELRMIFDGQLVAVDKDARHVYKASRNWNSDYGKYRKTNGDIAQHTSGLSFKQIVNGAEKIYRINEKPIDKDLQAERAKNPESIYFRYESTPWDPHNRWSSSSDIVNYRGDSYRGSELSYSTSRNIESYKKYYEESKQSAEKAKQKLAELKSHIGEENYNQELLQQKIKDQESEVSYHENNAKRYLKYYNENKANLDDYKAYRRNLASKRSLEGVVKEFFGLKNDYNSAISELNKASSNLENVKAQGSPKVVQYKKSLENAQAELKALHAKIAKLELYLEDADEENAGEVAKASELVDKLTDTVNGIQDKLSAIKGKREELEVEDGEQLEEAKVVSSFDSYKPWSGAIDTYETIKNAGKLDELEAIIDDLYPEGIDETQLNDILWFEDDWLYETLGIEGEVDEE